jgi:sulfite exporter TauE/SafE
MIFVVGLITGLHCIGMCGSFKGPQPKRKPEKKPIKKGLRALRLFFIA